MDFVAADWIEGIIVSYGYAAIFLIVMLESAGVPLPGETTLVGAAIFAGTRHTLQIEFVIAAAAAGAILGDNIGFWVGREVGDRVLDKWGHLIGLDKRKRLLGEYLFARHGGKIVFFGRFVALLRAYAALLAGVNHLPPLRFFTFNAAGGIIWATIFGLGGYFLGKSIQNIAGPIGWAALAGAVIGGYALWRYYKHHEERILTQAEMAMAKERAERASS